MQAINKVFVTATLAVMVAIACHLAGYRRIAPFTAVMKSRHTEACGDVIKKDFGLGTHVHMSLDAYKKAIYEVAACDERERLKKVAH